MADLATIRSIIPDLRDMEAIVARQQYQRPSVLERSGQWCIRPRVLKLDPETGKFDRVQTWIRLGPIGEMTRTQANREADRIMSTINDGKFVAAAQLEFAGIVSKYKEARLPALGARTQAKYRGHIDKHILPHFGTKRLAEIDTQAVEAWLVAKRSSLSDATRADLKNILSAIFTAATKWKYWSGENPCDAVELGRMEAKREKRLLTADETQRFFAALPNTRICTADTARLIAMTAVIAGLRVSEILGLQWGDVDLKGKSLTVRRRAGRGEVAAPKSKSSRRTRQIGQLADELAATKPIDAKPSDWVFSRDGEALDDRDLQQHVFRPAAELASIYVEGFGLHWLRAMNITLRQHAGASSIEAAQAAGHARPNVTALYTLQDPEREAAQVDQIFIRTTVKPN